MKLDEAKPTVSGVPDTATRDGTAPASPPCGVGRHAERSIWTNRMLDALATGSKRTMWYSLSDKVFSPQSLAAAADRVVANHGASGVDRMSVSRFNRARHRILPVLESRLKQKTYRHREVRRVWIPKPGKRNERRPLGIPTVVDRIVQAAVRNGLEPIFEAQFHDHSYGFRPGRSAQDALRHVTRTLSAGNTWVIDADLKAYFDTIDHDVLMDLIHQDVTDRTILNLIRQMLEAGVVEGDGQIIRHQPTTELGTPQGGVISPLLANIYLNDLDHQVNAEAETVMIRYTDDFMIFCRSEEQAHRVLDQIRQWTERRRLTLHPEKTRMVDMSVAGARVEFLGFSLVSRINRQTGRPRFVRTIREKSVKKFRNRIRPLTKRTNGWKLTVIIDAINPIVRGFGAYFRSAVANEHEALDKWLRMRLRSILRKRRKRKGRGRGWDHNRWPNAFFAEHGLVSLMSVHERWVQSPGG